MKKTFKRFMAFVMAGVLLASPFGGTVANASAGDPITSGDSPAQGEASASGDMEGYVDTQIFKVVLPTSADDTFNFIMDPQGLIAKTSGDRYDDATFESGANVYFNTASADASGDYKKTSKSIQVYNKGTVKVNVAVKATIDDIDGITMASGDTFASGDTTPGLYLAFTASGDADASGDFSKVFTEDGAELNAVLNAANTDYYEFTWASGDNKYKYDLTEEMASGDADDFPDYSFALTGACNSYADWSELTEAAPAVKITWSLTDAESGNPDIVVSKTASSTAAFSATAAANIESAEWILFNGASRTGTLTSAQCTISGSNISFASGVAKVITGNTTIKLTLADGTEQLLKIVVQ